MIRQRTRRDFKKWILVQDVGGSGFQTAGIRWYVEDVKPGPNTQIGPKGFFEIASDGLHLVWMALACMALIAIGGCGRKAPPVAPDRPPLTAVNDLQGRLAQGVVTLNWHHDPDNASAVGYVVYRAQRSASQPDCPDCPWVFQKVHTLTMDKTVRKKREPLVFRQAVPAGFQYTYKLRPVQNGGAQGPDSNLVLIMVP